MDKIFIEHLSTEINELIVAVSPIPGGDINHAAHIQTEHNEYFIKWNDNPLALQMFLCESKSLNSIALANTISTPKVIKCSSIVGKAYLLLEYVSVSSSPSNADLFTFGTQLAELHKVNVNYFGFERDNYIGTLNQANTKSQHWDEFYISQRLQPQINLAKKQAYLSNTFQKTIDRFYSEISDLLEGMKPSLLHGDLWSGNYLISENGTGYLVDPASYYGHREVDLAMSELFGGFSPSFYEGYNNMFKISEDYTRRKEVYQLYYLLVHLNLFGKSYESSCESILSKFD